MGFGYSTIGGNPVRRPQRGAAAVEYALVFPVLFLLFYGILSYGLIFLLRLSLQHSAEEGARAALRYQWTAQTQPQSAEQRLATQLANRMAAAEQTAHHYAGWIDSWTPPTVQVQACPSNGSGGSDCSTFTGAVSACGITLDAGCQIVVTVIYPYASHPLIPVLIGVGLMVPDRLVGQARVRLDGRTLTL